MKPAKVAYPALAPTQRFLLWVATAINTLMILPYLPLVLQVAVVLFLSWNLIQIRGKRLGVPRVVLLGLLALSALGLVLTTPAALTVEGGAMLAPIIVALKLLETRNRRDAWVAVLLIYFLALASFLFAQTMTVAGLTLLGVVISSAVLISLNSPPSGARRPLVLSATLIGQALPFMVILFVLFPRNLMPLWSLPASLGRASSGLKDYMAPGSISDLSLSGEPAFRVRFNGPPPPTQQLYWRGPVMSEFDGRTWRIGAPQAGPLPRTERGRSLVDYEITLEPHNALWLLALETPVSLPPRGYFTRDQQLVAHLPVRSRIRYGSQSALFLDIGEGASRDELAPFLRLPAGGNPRSRELAQRWREQFIDDDRLIDAAYLYFSQTGLTYTLNPPALGAQTIDSFLFETRRGFCEHFASAFVFLMRAAGIPARVVTGYQGGELNPIDGFLMVRQADAHAWAEVWTESRGWRRVDPTASAAPIRVIAGLATALPESDSLPLGLRRDLPWLRETRFRLEAINNGWNQWVLAYNVQSQRQLLSRFGLSTPDWRVLATASSLLVAIFMTALAVWATWPRRLRSPAQRAWLRVTRRLARRGLPPAPWEGPLDYTRRVAAWRGELGQPLATIAQLYAQLRYGPAPTRDALRTLNRLSRKFKP